MVAARRSGPRSNRVGPIRIVRPAKRVPPAKLPVFNGGALDATGMWIWYVSRSSGGDPAQIIAQANRYGVRTVFVKSSDGVRWWEQFSPALVAALKAGGLRVCAWQFVYGTRPAAEASLGSRAAAAGADCLVIDAESHYEGKYAQAQTYIEALRQRLGPDYPLAVAGFPYVDYHPAYPYSVFLGPGAAQYNVPQVYWKTIGTTVDRAVIHTYTWNVVYGRPISPLGQVYGNPKTADIKRFRQLVAAYGATGISWWSWQSASAGGWTAIGAPLPPLAAPAPATSYPTLGRGLGRNSRGDVVVWAQQHLLAAGQKVKTDGIYSATTEQVVANFQTFNALPVTGKLDPATWAALLTHTPAPVNWAGSARAAGLRNGGRNGPRSARLHQVRNELSGKNGITP